MRATRGGLRLVARWRGPDHAGRACARRRRARSPATRWPTRCRSSRRWRAAPAADGAARPAARRRTCAAAAAAAQADKRASADDRRRPPSARRRHHGRRPGRADAGAAAQAALRRPRRPGARAAHATRCRDAAHKVGESSVEIGAHYFSQVLGLKAAPARARSCKKFGFRFFFSEGRRDIDAVTEIGASRFLSVPSYQIDRGIFENFLGEEARAARRRASSTARGSATSSWPRRRDEHRIDWTVAGGERARGAHALAGRCLRPRRPAQAQARPGRAERATTPTPSGSASATASRSTTGPTTPAWRARCEPPARWLSTNHLVGAGYWVWLIPLASGSHSVGIVADAGAASAGDDEHLRQGDGLARDAPAAPVRRRSTASATCCRTSPSSATSRTAASRCSRASAGRSPARPGCSSTRSIRRAATSSPSATPTSPSWSRATAPAGRSRRTRSIYDQIFHSFYESTLPLYTGQYPIFGDPEVLPVKVIWDYTYYWGVLSQFFFQRRLADLAALVGPARRARALPASSTSRCRRCCATGRRRGRSTAATRR